MTADDITSLLKASGIRPTANRILITRALNNSHKPLSMNDLMVEIDTLDKSSISRVLNLLLEHDVVHAIEDGRGVVRYELCRGGDKCYKSDMHAHFFCEICHDVTCFEEIPVMEPKLPDGYRIDSINYMMKGVCDKCSIKANK